MSIRYSREAAGDVAEGIAYLAERDPLAAQRLRDLLSDLLNKLDTRVFEGPERTLKTGARVRAWPLLSWWLYYQRRGSELYVVRVHHQSRRPIVRKLRRRRRSS